MPGHLAEPDAWAAVATAPAAQRHGVAVLEERPRACRRAACSGSAPRHVSSIRLPRSLRGRSAHRARAEQIAGAGGCTVHGQVRELLGERPVHRREVRCGDLAAVQVDGEVEVEAPRQRRRAGRGRAAGPAPAVRRGTGAARPCVTTHGEMVVAKLFARCGPSGWYSKAWMSRADQSFSSTDAEDVPVGVRRAAIRVAGGPPTTKPTSSSMSSARVGASRGTPSAGSGTSPAGRTTSVPLTTTVPARPW